MIDYNDLINRIESMRDLPVSEEMLGAYCEGSLSPIDAASMDSCIANDATVSELIDSVDTHQVSENLHTFDYSADGVDDIDLPNVPMFGAFNPFDIGTISNTDDIGMVAVAPPAFPDIADEFVSRSDEFISDSDDITSSDDRFPSNGNSLKIKGDINNDNPLDDLNINNENSLI